MRKEKWNVNNDTLERDKNTHNDGSELHEHDERVIVVVFRLLLFAVHFTVKSSKNFHSSFAVIAIVCATLKILKLLFVKKKNKKKQTKKFLKWKFVGEKCRENWKMCYYAESMFYHMVNDVLSVIFIMNILRRLNQWIVTKWSIKYEKININSLK